jgi:hypothetical protein
VVNGMSGTCTDENSLEDGGLLARATTDMETQCRPLRR